MNFGTSQYIITVILLGTLLKCCLKRYPRIKNRLDRLVNSNVLVRLFIQVYYDLDIVAKVNIASADWSTNNPTILFSNILSVIVIILDVILPIVINCIHLRYNWRKWASEEFIKRYGAWLEGSSRMGEEPNVCD